MKFGIAIFQLVFAVSLFGQDSDPFSQQIEAVDPPPRIVSAMPSSITYEFVNDREHRYTISGIYNASQKAKEEAQKNAKKGSRAAPDPFVPDGESNLGDDYPEAMYKRTVTDCDDFTVDFETRKCIFLTSRKLALSELADAIDHMAWEGGDIPYWGEMEARDIAKSDQFRKANYSVEEIKEEFPANLAWFWVPENRQISTLIGVNEVEQGQLIFTPTTAHCMAHSRFAIRVLDSSGRILWHQDSIALASVRFTVADVDQDGLHDILLDRNDHGKTSRFLIKRNIEQNAAGQPATPP